MEEKTKHYDVLMVNYHPDTKLSEKNFFHIALLHAQLSGKFQLDETEKKMVANFIATDIKNIFFDKEVEDELINLPYFMPDSAEADLIESVIMDLPFRTRHLDELNEFLTSVTDNFSEKFNRIKKGEPLNEHEKVSLRQFAILQDMSLLKPIFDKLKEADLFKHNESLSQLYDKIEKCHDIVNSIELKIKIDSHYQIGLFATYHRPVSFEERLIDFFHRLTNIFLKKGPDLGISETPGPW